MHCIRHAWYPAFVVLVGLVASSADAQVIPVNVESTPPGATVFVDSTSAPAIGVTPLRNVRIARGSHTLIFRLEGHEEGRLPVTIQRRRESFRILLNALGRISISAGNDSANSASVRIDGNPVGNVPYTGTVQPGRHMVQVGREGYETFSNWVEIAGGQVLTLPVILQAAAPETGSILVAGNVSGAPVYLDGEARGVTPAVLEDVPAGEHVVEVRPDGLEVQRQTVFVRAGQRTNFSVQGQVRQQGSLRVITNVPGAVVTLDGEPIGTSPATASDVSVGQHIVEAQAEGYATVQETVTIEAGQQRVVSLRLTADARAAGRILVRSNVGAAIITIDGEERGSPPVVIESPAAGVHTVIATAEGYEDFRHTCETGPGRNCEIDAQLQPVGTPVRVTANARNAELYVDGDLIGPIPYEGNLPVGSHRLEVRAPNREAHVQQIQLVATSTPREFRIDMSGEGHLTEEERLEEAEERERLARSSTSHAAAPLPQEQAVLDMSIGWAFPLELRLGVGILDFLEGGFAFRSLMFRYNEFELRAKLGVRPLDQISAAVQVQFAGGLGPTQGETAEEAAFCADPRNEDHPACGGDRDHLTNSVRFSVEAIGSLHFADQGSFNLWLGVDIYSDEYDFCGLNSDIAVRSDTDLGDPSSRPLPEGADTDDNRCFQAERQRDGRQGGARFRLGGSLDFVLGRYWNMFALVEGVFGPSRDILGDIWGFGPEDTEFYFRLGFTHKF
jgi:hypothetical protein